MPSGQLKDSATIRPGVSTVGQVRTTIAGRLIWRGTQAYAAAVRFFGEDLGLEVAFDAGNTVELAAGNGGRIQPFGPGHRYFEFCRSHGDSIVPGQKALVERARYAQTFAPSAALHKYTGPAACLLGRSRDCQWCEELLITARQPADLHADLGSRSVALVARARAAHLLGIPFAGDLAVIGTRFGQKGTPGSYYNIRAGNPGYLPG